jgi:hypothetical protein
MGRENGIKIFRGVVSIIIGFIFGLGVSVLAWVNPSQSPPLGGGVLQTDTSGLKIVTTTQITTGNFTVNNGNVGIGTTGPEGPLHVRMSNLDNFIGPVRLPSTNPTAFAMWWRFEGWEPDKVFGIGIHSPTGQLGFWSESLTGGASLSTLTPGDPKMVISSNGNVGIGTTAPGAKLDVQDSAAAVSVRIKSTNAGASLTIDRQTTGNNAAISFRTAGSSIGEFDIGEFGAQRFAVRRADSPFTEWLSITNSGNVGIGTTAPANKLHVVGGNGLTVSGGQPLELISGGTIPVIKWYGNANLTFGNDPNIANIGNGFAGNQLVVITPSGNVGIGTTAPKQKLHVAGWAYIGPAGGSYILPNALSLEDQGSFFRVAFDDLRFYDWSFGGDMVTFKDGNVGIGTTAPDVKLAVHRPDPGYIFRIQQDAQGYNLWFGSQNGYSLIQSDRAGVGPQSLAINPNGGNVGIGTTAPDERLHVVGTSNAGVEVGIAKFQTGSALVDDRVLRISGLNNQYISLQTMNRVGVIAGNLVLQKDGGNVGIGTTAPNSKLQVTGGDIYVSTQGNGIILRDTDGTGCHRITVNSAGTITATAVTCP